VITPYVSQTGDTSYPFRVLAFAYSFVSSISIGLYRSGISLKHLFQYFAASYPVGYERVAGMGKN
jgi:hypothetical protein